MTIQCLNNHFFFSGLSHCDVDCNVSLVYCSLQKWLVSIGCVSMVVGDWWILILAFGKSFIKYNAILPLYSGKTKLFLLS